MPSINEVEERLGCRVRPIFATTEDIQRTIAEAWEETSFEAALVTEMDDDFEHNEQFRPSEVEGIDVAGESPIVNTVNAIIQRAIRERASDIHLEPGAVRSRVRMRVDGVLYEVMTPKADVHPALVSRLKVMANLDIAERRLPQDGRIQVQTRGQRVDLRFSSLPGLHGEKIVLRVLDKNQAILDVTQLGMANHVQSSFQNLLTRSHGLILVTGPTGSGKTTTLYAALSHLNNVERSVVTIEDPVEYQLDLINQNEVRPAVGLTFAKTLKHVLRQDPDIIMVGEIRDLGTADIAIKAAQTGHMVMSTLHTNDAPTTLTRMMNMGVAPFNIASSVILITAQRLARRLCNCKEPADLDDEALLATGFREEDLDGTWQPFKPVGCDVCSGSGYKGRVGIYQVMPISEEIQRIILNNGNAMEIAQQAQAEGINDLRRSGLLKVKQGLTSIEAVMAVTNE